MAKSSFLLMKIREFMKLGILSLNWVSEHYELEFVKSLISRTKFKIINIQLSISPVLQSAQPPIRFFDSYTSTSCFFSWSSCCCSNADFFFFFAFSAFNFSNSSSTDAVTLIFSNSLSIISPPLLL